MIPGVVVMLVDKEVLLLLVLCDVVLSVLDVVEYLVLSLLLDCILLVLDCLLIVTSLMAVLFLGCLLVLSLVISLCNNSLSSLNCWISVCVRQHS